MRAHAASEILQCEPSLVMLLGYARRKVLFLGSVGTLVVVGHLDLAPIIALDI